MRQPDSGWGPAWRSPYTAVLEVAAAVPGSEQGLEGDVRGWTESPGICVNLVITICIDVLRPRQRMGTMTIAKWEFLATNGNGKRKANRTTVLIIETQTNTVTGTVIDPRSGNEVPCDKLCIPFETILRRAPVSPEKNVVFDEEVLLKFADTTWKQVRAERSGGY